MSEIIRTNQVDLNAIRNRNGRPLLHVAVGVDDKKAATSICEALIQRGVKPNQKDDYDRTALMEMARSRRFNKEAAQLLCESVNDQDKDGRTALMFTVIGAGGFGSRKGNVLIARELLAMGADPFICDNRDRTALGWAIVSNDTQQNEPMIDFLQQKMFTETARREFILKNTYDFDKNGNIIVTPKP